MTFQDGYIKWIREHVGHQLIYLVYTTTFVFDSQNRLLVQERYDFDWLSVPGGALELGESLAVCARRETFEETHIDIELERFVGVFSHPEYELLYPNGDRVQPWMATFVGRPKNLDIQIDGQETLGASFQPVDAVRHRLPSHYQVALNAIEHHPTEAAVETVYANDALFAYYPILRAGVGQERIILPGGSAVIFNDAGQVLTVHETRLDHWDLPSGFADLGESSTATVVREVYEETGLRVEPTRVLGIYSEPPYSNIEITNGDKCQLVDLMLQCEIVEGEFNPQDDEVDAVRFMDINKLLAQPTTSAHRRRMLEDLKQLDKAPFIR
jgi:8-oxo-dGTP pyrophosphatase MutT (NUDIX family)